MQADLPFQEEEIVQRQLDEDLAILDSLPLATTSPSIHESDIDLRESPQPAHESPDPLDIITPADDDSELNPSPPHRHAETVQPSSPPPQLFERTDTTVAAEREHSEPPEIAEISGSPGDSEHLKPSEVVERSEVEGELQSDEPMMYLCAHCLNPLLLFIPWDHHYL